MRREIGVLCSGERVDLFLVKIFQKDFFLSFLSRSQISRLIKKGRVEINSKVCRKGGEIVNRGDEVLIDISGELRESVAAWDCPLDIVYEDKWILVLNKPAGVVMHPGAGNYDKTILNALFSYLKPEDSEGFFKMRGGIVHRLDKGTSGLVVIAKDLRTHAHLSEQFKKKVVEKRYLAVVYNKAPGCGLLSRGAVSGKISAPLGRLVYDPKKIGVLKKGGKEAVTFWKVKEIFKWAAILECKIITGRTHQIRVHLAHSGNPVLGDPVYGVSTTASLPPYLKEGIKKLSRPALHAFKLEFTHPVSNKQVKFEIELPSDITQFIQLLRKN